MTRFFPRLASGSAAGAVLALSAALTPPAAVAATTPLHVTVGRLEFQSYVCRPDQPLVCDVKFTGPVRSNLSTSPGTVDYTLVLTWEGAEGSPCNTVDETAVFTFDTGTFTTHSLHRDCPATVRPGPRVYTDFTVTGGTGAFADATGGGSEVAQGAFVYNGTLG